MVNKKQASQMLRILGDNTRFAILDAIQEQDKCVKEIAQELEMTHSAISHQLRILKEYNLVEFERRGKEVYYRVKDTHVSDIIHQAIAHILHE